VRSSFRRDDTFRIANAEVILVADAGDFVFYDCAYEELLQALGPINDDSSVRWSMFNDKVHLGFFGVYDQYILNVLYHPRIRPGMTRADVEALYEKIKRDDRHADATILVQETAAQRLFPMWAMRHDPAKSWMWTREQVSQGAVEAATRDEVLAIFVRLVAEQPGHLSGIPQTCPFAKSKP
jgi:hypothetical protein